MPRADECLNLREGKYFSKIDLKSGFWQIPLLIRDRSKTAFGIGSKYYQWKVMPMGMTNSPRTFQRLIDDTRKGIRGIFCYGYIDDIIIFSNTWEDHLVHVAEVLKRLSERRLRVALGKCRWGVQEVIFLGFKFSKGQIMVDPKKVEDIKKMTYPDTKDKAKGVKNDSKLPRANRIL